MNAERDVLLTRGKGVPGENGGSEWFSRSVLGDCSSETCQVGIWVGSEVTTNEWTVTFFWTLNGRRLEDLSLATEEWVLRTVIWPYPLSLLQKVLQVQKS